MTTNRTSSEPPSTGGNILPPADFYDFKGSRTPGSNRIASFPRPHSRRNARVANFSIPTHQWAVRSRIRMAIFWFSVISLTLGATLFLFNQRSRQKIYDPPSSQSANGRENLQIWISKTSRVRTIRTYRKARAMAGRLSPMS